MRAWVTCAGTWGVPIGVVYGLFTELRTFQTIVVGAVSGVVIATVRRLANRNAKPS